MPASIQPRGSRAQLRVTHKLLPRAFFHTFDTREEAERYRDQLLALLDRGIVPSELVAGPERRAADPLLIEVIRAYTREAPITESDDRLLTHLLDELAGLRVSALTWLWLDGYLRRLKLERRLAPSTIRKRIGVLGRVLDWHLRRVTPAGAVPPANVFRLLPRGFSVYSRVEAAELQRADPEAPIPRDVSRDRRLLPAEEARIRAALAGVKRDDRERALQVDPAFALLFDLILHTGLRLREAYRLRVDQVDLPRRLLLVEGSKGHHGVIKPRTVPLVRPLAEALQAWCKGRVGLLFPFWDGTPADLDRCTRRLSARFAVLFDYAQVPDLTEHDLRHEATCRWVEMRAIGRPGWAFSEVEVCKVMGWSDTRMMLRYASLRGEDLAARLG